MSLNPIKHTKLWIFQSTKAKPARTVNSFSALEWNELLNIWNIPFVVLSPVHYIIFPPCPSPLSPPVLSRPVKRGSRGVTPEHLRFLLCSVACVDLTPAWIHLLKIRDMTFFRSFLKLAPTDLSIACNTDTRTIEPSSGGTSVWQLCRCAWPILKWDWVFSVEHYMVDQLHTSDACTLA